MFTKSRNLVTVYAVVGLIVAISGTVQANWEETFNNNTFDLTTWLFRGYPELTGSFTATIQDGPDDNDYLTLEETSPAAAGGTQIGVGLGDPGDIFRDVRIGAVFNVNDEASRNYHGLAARVNYIIVPPGSVDPYPGMIASCYIMLFHFEEGPEDLKVELVKAANNSDTRMAAWQPEYPVPGLDHARSHYFELDVVGSDPVYITGSVYDYKGGPLLVRTPTFIDTSANDPWETPGMHDDVFTSGSSGIFGMWDDVHSVDGYHSPFDSVSSVSDGPAAVNPSPAIGATGLSTDVVLSWVEAEFATSRELWLGKAGAMEKVEPAPAGTTYTAGNLEFGQTYEWRVDQIGPLGTVTGHTWSFTTVECMSIDDFESYANNADIQAVWIDSVAGYDYVFLAEADGNKSMRFEFENQYPPYFTEATRTFSDPQDWTAHQDVKAISLFFYGEDDNVEHPMYLKLEDTYSNSWKVEHPYPHAVGSEAWWEWSVALEQFSNNDVDLSRIKKITIGTGSGADSGQPDGTDLIFIDRIGLYPARCFNTNQLDLRGDVNGDCKIDFKDIAIMGGGWLNDGLSAAP